MHQLVIFILFTISSVVFQKADHGYDTYRIPAVIQAPSGDLLAFAEARLDGPGDSGQIDLVMRRSADGGHSWGEMTVVWSEKGYTCGNPSPVVDAVSGRILLLATRNPASDTETDIRNGKSSDSRRVFILTSDDNGRNWSSPREITAQVKRPDWGWYATGPCHAIQLQHERFQGRIVVPCDHTIIRDGSYAGGGSHVIYSDDGGESWRIGGICPDGNECSVAETREGDLLLNMRLENSAAGRWPGHSRLLATSISGGERFRPVWTPEVGLQEPICQGSMANYLNRGLNTETILFTNPDDPEHRVNLTLKASPDGGRTWRKVTTLCKGHAAYSDLVVMSDGRIGVLYETGDTSPYERIVFQTVDSEIDPAAKAAWLADKYSMFIHFGVYSSLGGVFLGQKITRGYSEQIQANAGIQNDFYMEIAEKFNPVNFNADSVAALAKRAGMRSVVITSKHHDGYCMFGTSTTDFNSVKYFGRDIIGELSDACHRYGLNFGFYFSLVDWHDPYGNHPDHSNNTAIKPEHHRLNVRQVTELVSQYGPISEIFFDMGSLTKSMSEELYRIVHLYQPDCMVSGRLGNDSYDYCVMWDNFYPEGTLVTPWQSPASIFDETWGYRSWQVRENPDGKAAEKLHSLLVCVSHGGNFLLNIGPKGDGSLVGYERDVLQKIGSWLDVNGEAVYSAAPFAWPGIDNWGFCTKSGKDIYLIPSYLSADTVAVLPLRGARFLKAEKISNGEKVKVRLNAGNLEVSISASDASPMPEVIRLSFDKAPEEPARKLLDIYGTDSFDLNETNSVPDHSFSCTNYADNHQSIVGYVWTVTGKKISSISIEAPSALSGRRINLSIDGAPVLENATLTKGLSVVPAKPLAAGTRHTFHLTAADMDNPYTDIRLEGIKLTIF